MFSQKTANNGICTHTQNLAGRIKSRVSQVLFTIVFWNSKKKKKSPFSWEWGSESFLAHETSWCEGRWLDSPCDVWRKLGQASSEEDSQNSVCWEETCSSMLAVFTGGARSPHLSKPCRCPAQAREQIWCTAAPQSCE